MFLYKAFGDFHQFCTIAYLEPKWWHCVSACNLLRNTNLFLPRLHLVHRWPEWRKDPMWWIVNTEILLLFLNFCQCLELTNTSFGWRSCNWTRNCLGRDTGLSMKGCNMCMQSGHRILCYADRFQWGNIPEFQLYGILTKLLQTLLTPELSASVLKKFIIITYSVTIHLRVYNFFSWITVLLLPCRCQEIALVCDASTSPVIACGCYVIAWGH